jgi:cytidine deaminase
MDQRLFQELFDAAAKPRRNSDSPISNFKVGAAFRTETGSVYAGTNAEEPAFSHSIHAEQGAAAQMVAKEGRKKPYPSGCGWRSGD